MQRPLAVTEALFAPHDGQRRELSFFRAIEARLGKTPFAGKRGEPGTTAPRDCLGRAGRGDRPRPPQPARPVGTSAAPLPHGQSYTPTQRASRPDLDP